MRVVGSRDSGVGSRVSWGDSAAGSRVLVFVLVLAVVSVGGIRGGERLVVGRDGVELDEEVEEEKERAREDCVDKGDGRLERGGGRDLRVRDKKDERKDDGGEEEEGSKGDGSHLDYAGKHKSGPCDKVEAVQPEEHKENQELGEKEKGAQTTGRFQPVPRARVLGVPFAGIVERRDLCVDLSREEPNEHHILGSQRKRAPVVVSVVGIDVVDHPCFGEPSQEDEERHAQENERNENGAHVLGKQGGVGSGGGAAPATDKAREPSTAGEAAQVRQKERHASSHHRHRYNQEYGKPTQCRPACVSRRLVRRQRRPVEARVVRTTLELTPAIVRRTTQRTLGR